MKAREAAYQTLMRIEQEQAFTNLALQQTLRKTSLEQRDRALTTELVYGTVQRQRTLDALLQPLSKRPLPELAPQVRVLLRMSVYQLSFLDKIPTYAVLNEAVSLCKTALPRASGFVNGVLRSFVRDSRPWLAKLGLDSGLDSADDLGLAYSYPTWLVTRLLERYGRSRTESILQISNQQAHLSVRVNPLRADRTAVLERISHDFGDIAEPSAMWPEGIRFVHGLDVENWDAYTGGEVTVQDEGAMLIAPLLAPAPGQNVADLCAAPGTKTTHLAELMGNRGTIIGSDLHAHKIKLIRQAATRLGLDAIQTATADARLLPAMPGYEQRFDAVLLDAPCSGFGVLRHRPDIRWKRTEEDVVTLATLQRQLLLAAVRLVRPGGSLVYSTCTLLPEENEAVVQAAMAESGRQIEVDLQPGLWPEHLRDQLPLSENGLVITPDLFDTDGFYMIRLRIR